MNIYNDIVYPELNNLDLKLKQIQQGSFKRTFGAIIVVSSVIVANAFGGMINPAFLAATVPFGTTVAAVGLNTLLDKQSNKKAVLQDNDFYFLWRLKQNTK